MATESALGFGNEKGEQCWRNGCVGIIDEHKVEDCSCHINPPCGACTTPREFCPDCGWEARDEGEHLNDFIAAKSKPYEWKPRPLDSRKIDWHSKSHTHFTMIKEGVYPPEASMENVRAIVNETFGGRFVHFGDGKFKFIAYTD